MKNGFANLGALPLLSRQALELRLRLASAFMEERDAEKCMRLLKLIGRANDRFERREKASRELCA